MSLHDRGWTIEQQLSDSKMTENYVADPFKKLNSSAVPVRC